MRSSGGVLVAPAVGLVLLAISEFARRGLALRPLLIVTGGIVFSRFGCLTNYANLIR